MVLAAVATLVGASVASATGFGFALILSPAMFAVLDPEEAVTTLLVLGLALNLLMLFGAGGRPRAVRWRAVTPMLLAALPGLGAGILLLALMSKPVLQIAVGAGVVAAAGMQARTAARAVAEPREPALASACAVGLASGALTTSVAVSGPPLVLWLRAHGIPAEELRASLAASFLGLAIAGGAVLAGGGMLSIDPAVALPLLGLTLLGQIAGERVSRGIDQARLRRLVLALVLAAGLGSLAAGLAGLA